MGLSKSTYYYEIGKTDKVQERNADITSEITTIFYEHKQRYGVRRVHQELLKRGFHVNHKRVQRIILSVLYPSGHASAAIFAQQIPFYVVLSYIKGVFSYCPVLPVLFTGPQAYLSVSLAKKIIFLHQTPTVMRRTELCTEP